MDVVRFVGLSDDMDQRYSAALNTRGTIIVDTLPDGANVTVSFKLDGSPLQVDLSPTMRDIFDLAATVYIADEHIARADSQDGWTRDIGIQFPVKDLPRWKAVEKVLREALRILSGDRVSFSWVSRPDIANYGQHRAKIQGEFDCVCLFSGGMDSLLGAHQLLSKGKRVLLVGHQADGLTASAQSTLFDLLRKQFSDRVSFVQCRIARSLSSSLRHPLPAKVEDSHRPRSLLFLGVAIAVASAAKVKAIVLPENGLIAINAPFQLSRIGTLSTRTAHPAFLLHVLQLLRGLNQTDWSLTNPFLFQSKTDIVESASAEARALLPHTVSCAHAGNLWRDGVKKIRHCGYCVPCIYRRAALASVGLDRRSRYVEDVFRSLSSLTSYRQSDFRAMASFARKVVAMTEAERQLTILSNGHFPPDAGNLIGPNGSADYSPWSAMLLRWAESFLRQTQALASGQTKQILGTQVKQTKKRK